MKNSIETIQIIKDFFKSIGFDSADIVGNLKRFQTKEAVLKRYSHFIKDEYQDIIETREESSMFRVYIKNIEVLNQLKNIFTEKVIYDNDSILLDKELLESLLNFCKFFKDDIEWTGLLHCSYFNWTAENIKKGFSHNIWKRSDISKSTSIKWNIEILEKCKNILDWKEISKNPSLPWDFELIEKFKEYFDWKEISKNPSLPWSFELIEKFKEYFDWRAIKANKLLIWNDELVDKYAKYIFSVGYIKTKEINWEYGNPPPPHKLFFGKEKEESSLYFENNKNIFFSEYLIDKYADNLNFYCLSQKGNIDYQGKYVKIDILFTDYLVEKYADKWDFKELSKSAFLRISTRVIEKFIDRWDWKNIVRNRAVKLEFSTIEKVKDILDWGFVKILPNLYWTEELIDKYYDYIFSDPNSFQRIKEEWPSLKIRYLDHTGYFESNKNVEWTPALIDKYKDKWMWEYIFRNNKIKFSEDQLSKYNDLFSTEILMGNILQKPWELFFKFGNTDWNEHIIDKYNKITHTRPNGEWVLKYSDELVYNPNIFWNETLFNKYVANSRCNIGYFCENAMFERKIIVNNQNLWNKKKIAYTDKYKERGDWCWEDVYKPLWWFLSRNKNVIWDEKLLELCIKNITLGDFNFSGIKLSVNFIDKYWENLKDGMEKKYFKPDFGITNLTFESFITHEFKWFGYLIKEYNFQTNKSILCFLQELQEELARENDFLETENSNSSTNNLSIQKDNYVPQS